MALLLEIIQHFDDSGQRDRPPRAARRAPPTSSSARSSSCRRTSGRSSTATARPSTPSASGRHTLTTLNLPLLAKLIGLPFGGKSPFQAQVYFVSRQTFTDLKWGTKEPIAFRDSELTMVRLRAFGRFSMRVAEPQIFLQQLVGTRGQVHHRRRRGLPARHVRGAPQRPARRDAEDRARPARGTTTSWPAGSRAGWRTTSPSTAWSSWTSSSAPSRRPRKSRR